MTKILELKAIILSNGGKKKKKEKKGNTEKCTCNYANMEGTESKTELQPFGSAGQEKGKKKGGGVRGMSSGLCIYTRAGMTPTLPWDRPPMSGRITWREIIPASGPKRLPVLLIFPYDVFF